MAGPYLFDTERFEQRVGDLSSFRKAALVFLALLPQWTALARAAAHERDWTSLDDQVHQMKGCCSMLCAFTVHDQSCRVEASLKRGHEAEIREAVDVLFQLVEAAEAELRSVWLESP